MCFGREELYTLNYRIDHLVKQNYYLSIVHGQLVKEGITLICSIYPLIIECKIVFYFNLAIN